MKRPYLWFAFAVAALAASPDPAGAQPPAPGGARPPAFSPYLNLTRPGAPTYLNYYGLVRPELQFRQSIDALQRDVTLNQQVLGGLVGGDPGLTATGHPTQFMNHGFYFMNNGGFNTPIAGGAAGGPPPVNNTVGGTPAPRRR